MRILIQLLLALTLSGGEVLGQASDQEAWLKKAQLGPFAPKAQDWEAIKSAAKNEGKVVIYSVSSRIFKLQKDFKQKFGVEIEAHDIASDTQLEKFRREHRAGLYNVDVLFNNESPLLLNEFLPKKLVWNFVPDSVVPLLEKDEIEPFLVQRWSSRIVMFNGARNPSPPINNLWDLTRKEWKGKVLVPNPIEASVMANALQTILQHPDAMAEAYKQAFGAPVTFSEKVTRLTKRNVALAPADAAKEWLYRLIQNAVFIESTDKIYQSIGDVKQQHPPIGISTFSKIRDNKPGVYDARPAYEAKPAFGVTYPTVLVIADRARDPNAAKLLIRYMMEEGFEPWNEPGDYAARSDVVKKQVTKFNIPPFDELKLWKIDPNHIYDTRFSFVELFLGLR
ncbi:MAG: ABC transporter substrate-binding protein [Candidatus Binatia bacterium]